MLRRLFGVSGIHFLRYARMRYAPLSFMTWNPLTFRVDVEHPAHDVHDLVVDRLHAPGGVQDEDDVLAVDGNPANLGAAHAGRSGRAQGGTVERFLRPFEPPVVALQLPQPFPRNPDRLFERRTLAAFAATGRSGSFARTA